jgi:hypothetical protein
VVYSTLVYCTVPFLYLPEDFSKLLSTIPPYCTCSITTPLGPSVKSSTWCPWYLHSTLQCTFSSYLYTFKELLVHLIRVLDAYCTTTVPGTRSTKLRPQCIPSVYFQELLAHLPGETCPLEFSVLNYSNTAHVI